MIELAGWLSSLALGLCAIPQVIHTWKTGKTDGISVGFLLLWLVGEVFGLIYLTGFDIMPMPLLVNYMANTIAISYILWKKLRSK